MKRLNIFGEPLKSCCTKPMTGYFRDGFCRSDNEVKSRHLICIIATDNFLAFSKEMGNDLSTPHPEWNFPGLKAGDKWCLLAPRWREAYDQGKAPTVVLEACAEEALEFVSIEMLIEHAYRDPKAKQI